MQTDFSDKITTSLNGLLYISESEAPVELLYWPGIKTLEAAQQKAADLDDTKPEEQTLQPVEDFLTPIQKMATPEDPAMEELSKRWTELLQDFQKKLCDVQVISGPVKEGQQQLYIIGFTEEGTLALHTSAVVT